MITRLSLLLLFAPALFSEGEARHFIITSGGPGGVAATVSSPTGLAADAAGDIRQ
jgi:hypothetical protein